METASVFSSLMKNVTSASELQDGDETPLDSLPLYILANYLLSICSPVIVLLGTFGNVMTVVIMRRMTSRDSVINYYFTGMAVMDLLVLFFMSFMEWLSLTFNYRLLNISNSTCKLFVWFSTGSGTISCWYLVCLTLHRAMSVMWPHRVGALCTRPAVLGLLLGTALFFAALYSHYLYGFNLVSTDGGRTYQCMMESQDYILFVFEVFVYVEVAIYSLIPFAFLVLGNGILVWGLLASVRQARQKLSQGNTEQILAREKAANAVTLTVLVVSVTFIALTLPVSVNYILTYFAREYGQVSGVEYAKVHMFYVVSSLLADSNSAVNFYLYCLTGSRFREEFFRILYCGRLRPTPDAVSKQTVQSAHH